MRLKRILFIFCIFTIMVSLYVFTYYLFNKINRKDGSIGVSTISYKSTPPNSRAIFYVVVVVCGQKLQETFTMIKSALIYNYPKELLKFIVFVEDSLRSDLDEKLTDWRNVLPGAFTFELRPLKFPQNSEKEWRSLFKPCAAQRLFLPSLLTDIDSVLYVDTDILFLSPVADIWRTFRSFNSTQIAGLSSEHEDSNIGWYNRFARHPFYGKLGLNSGVMLMNLTQMRQFNWESRVVPIYKEYKLRLTWGDQDIINILFYYHPEKLYLFPCEYNYRPDHCMYTNVCKAPEGIKIIHGNRGYFHFNKQPLFKAIYETVEDYQLDGGSNGGKFLRRLRAALDDKSVQESNCGKVSNDILKTTKIMFSNDYNYEE